MARKIEVQITGDSRSLERAFGRATHASAGFGRVMGGLAKSAVIAGAAITAGVAVGAKKAVDAASNLEEQLAKSSVVFGESGAAIQKWSGGTADSFGLSQRAALEAAGTYGNMLVPMGFARDEAAGMSRKFVELAADMASFNNVGTDEALAAIQSGLAGQTEPLRRFGVFLDAAKIKAQALSMGFKAVKGQLDPMAKAAASAAIIMKETGDTQGDVSRTADSLANVQRRLGAQFEDMAAKGGRVLLPVVARLAGGFSDFISRLNKAEGAGAKFRVVADEIKARASQIWEAFSGAVSRIDWGAVAATIATGLSSVGGKIKEGIVNAFNSVDWTATGNSVRDAVVTAFNSVDWSATGTQIIDGISSALKGASELAKRLADTIMGAVRKVDWMQVGKVLGPGLAAALVTAFATLTDPAFWAKNWDLALAVGLVAFGGPLLKMAGALLRLAAAPLARLGGDMLLLVVGGIERLAPRLADEFLKVTLAAARALAAAAKGIWGLVERALTNLWEKLPGILRAIITVGWIAAVASAISAVVGAITGAAGKVWGAATRLAQGIVDKIKDILSKAWSMVLTELGKIQGAITMVAGQAAGWAASIGSAVISGIISGLAGLAGRVGSAIAGGFKRGVDWAKNNIGSTAGEYAAKMIGIPGGEGITEGFILGSAELPDKIAERISAAILRAQGEVTVKGGLVGEKLAEKLAEAKEKAKTRADEIGTALAERLTMAMEKARGAVELARDRFGEAFSELGAKALTAYDRIWADFKTPAEKMLEKMRSGRDAAAIKEAISEAQKGLAAAKAERAGMTATEGETPEAFAGRKAQATTAVAAAEKTLEDAKWREREAGLTKAAEQQRRKWDNEHTIDRENFEKKLTGLQEKATREGMKQNEFQAALVRILRLHGVNYKNAGQHLGESFAQGLRQAEDQVANAADLLAQTAARALGAANAATLSITRSARDVQSSIQGRAGGGPVSAGSAYVVGEKGPELFLPRSNGVIVPSAIVNSETAMRGGGGAGSVINFSFPRFVGDRDELMREVRIGFAELRRDNPSLFGALG